VADASPKTPAGRRIRGLDADQRRAQRRNALLDAALDLFAEQGYLSTSIEQICQRAYVGTKSFYEVFDGRESCYVALLRRIVERTTAHMARVLEGAPDDEPEATRILIEAFAHSFVDDVRLAKVTFGEGSAITPAAERQRRANRRWAADFIESIWQRYGVGSRHTRGVAVGVVGGLFEIVADWVHDADVPDDTAVTILIRDLSSFYGATRAGMQPSVPDLPVQTAAGRSAAATARPK
jgi:AcrR family transcriptional regulator